MTKRLNMVVEHYRGGDAVPVYRRFRDRGRLAPDGLDYVASWVDDDLRISYQLMETDDRTLLDQWIANWTDLVESRSSRSPRRLMRPSGSPLGSSTRAYHWATACEDRRHSMDARVGDRIVLESDKVGAPPRQGEILKVIPHEPHVEFQVRWDDGHVTEIRPSGASYRILSKANGGKA